MHTHTHTHSQTPIFRVRVYAYAYRLDTNVNRMYVHVPNVKNIDVLPCRRVTDVRFTHTSTWTCNHGYRQTHTSTRACLNNHFSFSIMVWPFSISPFNISYTIQLPAYSRSFFFTWLIEHLLTEFYSKIRLNIYANPIINDYDRNIIFGYIGCHLLASTITATIPLGF